MLLSTSTQAVQIQGLDGDLTKVEQTTLFSSPMSKFILFFIIMFAILGVMLVYLSIAKQKNKDAGESIFIANKKKASYNRILLLYNTLDALPPTRKYLNRLRREFEMIAPGDGRFAKERAVWITLGTWGGGLLAGILTLILKPTLYMLFVVIFTVYVVSQEIVNSIVERNELNLMHQFLQFLSRFRYHYLIENTVDDAIDDAIAEVPHLMQLHAKLILSVLQSPADKIDENLLRYKNSISNLFLKQFLAICNTTMQNGDIKVDGQSLCLTNVKDLKVDVEIEIRKRKDINAGFKALSAVIVVPIYTMQFISNWAVKSMAPLQTFYYGTLGNIVMMACFVVTIAVYAYVNSLKETHHQQASEHYVLRAICKWKLVKKFTDNYWNRNYGKKLQVEKVLRRTGNTIKPEHFLVRSLLCGFAAIIATLVIFECSNVSTKKYVNTDFTAIASEASSATEEQMVMIMMLTRYYYDCYRDQNLLQMYNEQNHASESTYTDQVKDWFYSLLDTNFTEGGAQLTQEQALDMIHQYNQVNSANTMLYTSLFGTTGVPEENVNDVESVKAFNQMRDLIKKCASEDPLINTTGLYEIVEQYVWDKYTTYHKTYFHWWYVLIAVLAGIAVYNVPMIVLRMKEEELQFNMQEEVTQFYSIILLLIFFENVNALTILEWMNLFADIFEPSIAKCITEFTMDEQKALQALYDNEPFEPFQRIVENLMMVDDVGVLQAFNELPAIRKSNQETRSQDNKNIIAARASKANLLAMAPMSFIIIGYLVAPLMMEAFKEMGKLVNEISTM